MSKISISVEDSFPIDNQDSRLVFSLSRCLGLSLIDIKDKLKTGSSDYLYRSELYLNDHVAVDKKLRELLLIFKNHKVTPYILEIPYDATWEQPIDIESSLISAEDLIEMLDSSQVEYE